MTYGEFIDNLVKYVRIYYRETNKIYDLDLVYLYQFHQFIESRELRKGAELLLSCGEQK